MRDHLENVVQPDSPGPLGHRVYLANEARVEKVVYLGVKVNPGNKVKLVRKDPVDQQASRANAAPMDPLDQLVDLAVLVRLGNEAKSVKLESPARQANVDLRA